jgi:flagellar basal body-associated protein FliL
VVVRTNADVARETECETNMADEEAKKPDAAAQTEATEESSKKKSMATMGIFGTVMLAEGLAIFFAMRFFGSEPDPAAGMEPRLTTATQPFSERREIEVAHVRVQNSNGERSTLYSVTINIVVDHAHEEMIVEDFLKNRQATITDAISRILRSSEEKHLSEPGLETLKRQISFELGVLLKDDTIIEEVLIPEFTPLPTGF